MKYQLLTPREDRKRAIITQIRRLQTELALLETADVDPPTPRGPVRPIPDCGTEQAYQRHKHYGEQVDDACRRAHNTHTQRKSRARRKQAAA